MGLPNTAELSQRFEMSDGSRPEAKALGEELARTLPLDSMALLESGDVFELVDGRPPREGPARARVYLESHVELVSHGVPAADLEFVKAEVQSQLASNLQLIARLSAARPLSIELIPAGVSMKRYGYPPGVSARAAGLFWDSPKWPRARIALRQDKLRTERALVIHEMAHAIHALAFSEPERQRIYRLLWPTYRSQVAIDEVFAIYSEREFLESAFSAREQRAPGVYGMARQRWSEAHLFTRFVRHLYFPHKPLAEPTARSGAW